MMLKMPLHRVSAGTFLRRWLVADKFPCFGSPIEPVGWIQSMPDASRRRQMTARQEVVEN